MAQREDHRERRPGRSRRTPPRGPAFTPQQVETRRAALPAITYPEELPVSARREDIAAAVAENQVVIIAGETGSGKTTQIPKICLELGRGITGIIGHTQPRRIAARSVAERIAEELRTPLGQAVGYQVRFTDVVSDTTLVKLMTDGILLAEIQRDPLLSRYDTIIVDEAHERSLNIDFLLGYLSNLLPRRPDLKVIVTSATIDSERFAAHFGPHMATPQPHAPVVEVSGRTYPVEIRYRPLVQEVPDDGGEGPSSSAGRARGERSGTTAGPTRGTGRTREQSVSERRDPLDQFTAICLAADELMREGPGDILVFLSGEGEIRDAQNALADHLGERYITPPIRSPRYDAVEVVPLYARLSAAEQHRVFEKHSTRRIVLATNVAETSLTVPGIRYVIDPGTARISRYSTRTKVQRLPIEPISQASANQRSGRCGRVADGIAIRLYSETDFESRPEYTEPEILRTSLASVILQMTAIGLGDVAHFPFVDPPDTKAIRDGIAQLLEIGALHDPVREGAPGSSPGLKLTPMGRRLAALPIDPRLGRMLLQAQENGCASEMLVIVAALSVQDVRERPTEKRAQADQMHLRFTDPTSDFLAYLNIWRYLRAQQRDLTGSAFRRMCRAEYINFLRVREWQDVVAQLRQLAKPLGLTLRPIKLPGRGEDPLSSVENQTDADSIHRSLLVGLLSNLGSFDAIRREYAGARGTRFVVWPGSGLAKKTYDWVMAAELVETSRLFARTVAKINPDWIEHAAAHVVKKVHSEPFWSSRRGAAMIHEKVLLYGVPVVADRVIPLAQVGTVAARDVAREMFIRHALVEGEWRTHHKFWAENQKLLEEAEEVEHRARRRGLLADSDVLERFYDDRIPSQVTSTRHFDSWWKDARRETPDLLTFSRELLLPGVDDDAADFPATWTHGDITLELAYAFTPGERGDGVTVRVPLAVLPRLSPEGFDWLVPGLLSELAVASIRGLPKKTRVQLVPAPDTAATALRAMPAWDEGMRSGTPFTEAFATAVRETTGVTVPVDEFDPEALPDHLRMRFAVVDDAGKVLGSSPHLLTLQRRFTNQARDAVRSAVHGAVALAMEEAALRTGGGRVDPATGARDDGLRHPRDDDGRTTDSSFRGREAHRGIHNAAPPAHSGQPHTHDDTAQTTDPSFRGREAHRGIHNAAPPAQGAGFTEQEALQSWPAGLDEIPASVSVPVPGGLEVRGYPALVSLARSRSGTATRSKGRGKRVEDFLPTVDLRVLTSAVEQEMSHGDGVRSLAVRGAALASERVSTRWAGADALTLASSPYPSTPALVADIEVAAAKAIEGRWVQARGSLAEVRSLTVFQSFSQVLKDQLEDEVYRQAGVVVKVLNAAREAEAAIRGATSLSLLNVVTDVKDHVSSLVYPGFVGETPPEWLRHLPRFLEAARLRIERAASGKPDATPSWQIHGMQQEIDAAQAAYESGPPDSARAARLDEARWLLEELRVSLFAQQLGTSVKVSDKRIRTLLRQ